MQIIKIKSNDTNIRLDRLIRKIYPNLSLSLIYKLIRTKKILVNDSKVEISYKLQLNDVVKILINCEQNKKNGERFLNAKANLEIIYEDDNLIVVNKPVGLLVYDEKDSKVDTLINRVKKYLYNTNKWNPKIENQFEPSLLHRLDFNTSGLVMVAKNHKTLEFLNVKIRNREIDKYYQCLVHGKMDKNQEILIAYWKKSSNDNIVSIKKDQLNGYSKIITKYKVIDYDKAKNVSSLEVLLVTGKTHQIRAHMAFINHPLVGEQKYKNSDNNDSFGKKCQALVAYKIIFNFQDCPEEFAYLNKKIIQIKLC